MMNRLFTLPLLLLMILPFNSYGDASEPDSFKNYVRYKLNFNLLFLDPELAKGAKTSTTPDPENYTVISFPFRKSTLSVTFDPGPSDDPTFAIKYERMEEYLNGERLYIASTGFLYLVKRSNENFEKKLKFRIANKKLKEIKQPFYLVDKKCKTSTMLSMYDEKCNKGNLIAKLPKGSTVHILLMESTETIYPVNLIPDNEIGDHVNNYLVSTPFGLVGWVVSSRGYLTRPGKPLECIVVHGD